MPIVFSKPTTKRFEIVDAMGDYVIEVHQISIIDREVILDPSADIRVVVEGGQYRGIQRNDNRLRYIRFVAYRALGKVVGLLDENHKELFSSKTVDQIERVSNAMSESEFANAWAILPDSVINKIMECIYDVNPDLSRDYAGN